MCIKRFILKCWVTWLYWFSKSKIFMVTWQTGDPEKTCRASPEQSADKIPSSSCKLLLFYPSLQVDEVYCNYGGSAFLKVYRFNVDQKKHLKETSRIMSDQIIWIPWSSPVDPQNQPSRVIFIIHCMIIIIHLWNFFIFSSLTYFCIIKHYLPIFTTPVPENYHATFYCLWIWLP